MQNLARKTIVGFVRLFVTMAALIFLPAGTLHYWQAWVYLANFMTVSALITIYVAQHDPRLLERRVASGPRAEKEPAQKRIMWLATAGFIAISVVPALDHRFGWSHVPVWAVIGGDALIVLGFFIIFLVFKENSFAAATIQVAPDQKVISTGPYARVRHPMYTGGLLLFTGMPPALDSWWGLLVLIPLTFTIVWRLLDEEKFLSRSLPGYDDYCRKVRWRLVPGVW